MKKIVKAQMSKGNMQEMIQQNAFAITYTDDTGDVINVSDDEDLFTAYEVAETCLGNQLKLNVKPREAEDADMSSLVDASLQKSIIKASPSQEANEGEKASESSQMIAEDDKLHVSQIRAAIQDNILDNDQDMLHEDDDSSDSDAEQINPQKKDEKKHKKIKKDKKKDKNGGLPRKTFKKLIKKELEKQQKTIMENLMNCPQISEMVDQADAEKIINQDSEKNANQVVHANVACDGCNVSPIVGPRFKCSICKNFDYCQTCEERRGHEHAFLKIANPSQAPKAIFMVIDENVPNANADLEQDQNTFFRCMGPQQ